MVGHRGHANICREVRFSDRYPSEGKEGLGSFL